MIAFGLSTPNFLLFDHDWLFPPSAREVSPGNRSNYKSTRERVDSEITYLHHREFSVVYPLLDHRNDIKSIQLHFSRVRLFLSLMDPNLL